MTIEQTPFHLSEILLTTHQIFTQIAEQKKLVLRLEQAHNISSYVIGDALRLRQVLTNLLSNALKFTEQGYIRIGVTLDEQQQLLRFEVEDTGIGMSASARDKLFQSFTQADASTSRKYGGTGLGLTICKELVVLMGGDIGVNSELGKGSCFWFTLPYKPSDQLVNTSVSTSEMTVFVDKKILLVEDNLVNQKVALKLLEKFGLQADLAENGQQAIDHVSQKNYDLILMDCQMPVMDGYTATRILRSQQLKTPIVAMTANASAEDRSECIACGMNDFIAKPYQLHELSALLQRWLKD